MKIHRTPITLVDIDRLALETYKETGINKIHMFFSPSGWRAVFAMYRHYIVFDLATHDAYYFAPSDDGVIRIKFDVSKEIPLNSIGII